jgi:hypothetical protein
MKEINKIQDIGELTSIINSRAYRQVLDERRKYLQDEANNFIRQQKWTEAYGAIMRMDDLMQTLKMLELQLEKIKKEK